MYAHEARRAREELEFETRTYEEVLIQEAQLRKTRGSRADILEGMAGDADCTKLAPLYNLTALQPCDTRYGWDLNTATGDKMWRDAVEKGRPLVTIVGFKCTEWCRFNVYKNYKGREAELKARVHESFLN